MRNQTINLNLIPGGVMPVVHLSQYDQDVDGSLIFNIYNGPVPYDLTGCIAHIQGVKPDGNVFDYECTVYATYVTSATQYQMTTYAGDYEAELRISNNGSTVGTINFTFSIERAASGGADLSQTDIPAIMDQITSAASQATTAATVAQEAKDDAAESESNSEAWAVGQRNGVDVPNTDPTYQNNSKYYATEAGDSATAAAESEDNAKDSEDNAAESESNAEAWAVGKRGGVDVPTTDPTYHNNSKYYAESIGDDKEDAEAWAVGTRNGVPVANTDPTYHNNSKYWSEQSAGQTLGGLSDVDIDNPQEGDGIYYDPSDQKWKNGQKGINYFVSIPTVEDLSFTYDGTAQGPTITWTKDESAYVTITNATKTNAGTYELTITLKNTQTSVWQDLTTAPKKWEYTIAKANGSVTLSSDSVTLDKTHLTATVTVSEATGDLSFESDDTTIATVSPATMTAPGGTLTVSNVDQETGEAEITVTVAASDNYKATTATIGVTATFVTLVPWTTASDEEIAAMVQDFYDDKISILDIVGDDTPEHPGVWHVGDVRTMNITQIATSGTANGFTWEVVESHHAQTVDVVIMGFEHDDLTTAVNGHTKALVTAGMQNCLYMGASKPTSESVDGSTNTENGYMDSSGTNAGGWTNSDRRQWCNGGFYSAMPEDIRNEVKQVRKQTTAGSQSSQMNTDDDWVFLPSEYEVFGEVKRAKAQEGNQYSYYTTEAYRYKYPKHNSSSVSGIWWERSPSGSTTGDFCAVGTAGDTYMNFANYERGLSPAWAM